MYLLKLHQSLSFFFKFTTPVVGGYTEDHEPRAVLFQIFVENFGALSSCAGRVQITDSFREMAIARRIPRKKAQVNTLTLT